jgi:hypothetical protein
LTCKSVPGIQLHKTYLDVLMLPAVVYNFQANDYVLRETPSGLTIEQHALASGKTADTDKLIIQIFKWVDERVRERQSTTEKRDADELLKLTCALDDHLENSTSTNKRVVSLVSMPAKRFIANFQKKYMPTIAQQTQLPPLIGDVQKALKDIEATRKERIQTAKKRIDQLVAHFESAVALLKELIREKVVPEKELLSILTESPVYLFDEPEIQDKIFKILFHILYTRKGDLIEIATDKFLAPYAALGEVVEQLMGIQPETKQEIIAKIFNFLLNIDGDLSQLRPLFQALAVNCFDVLQPSLLHPPLDQIAEGYAQLKSAKELMKREPQETVKYSLLKLHALELIGEFINPDSAFVELLVITRETPPDSFSTSIIKSQFFNVLLYIYISEKVPKDKLYELLRFTLKIDQDFSFFKELFKRDIAFADALSIINYFKSAILNTALELSEKQYKMVMEIVNAYKKLEEAKQQQTKLTQESLKKRKDFELAKSALQAQKKKLEEDKLLLEKEREGLTIFHSKNKDEIKQLKERIGNFEKQLESVAKGLDKLDIETRLSQEALCKEKWLALKEIGDFITPSEALKEIVEISSMPGKEFIEAKQAYLKLRHKTLQI